MKINMLAIKADMIEKNIISHLKTSPRAQYLRWVKVSNPQNINPAVSGIFRLATLPRLPTSPKGYDGTRDLEPN